MNPSSGTDLFSSLDAVTYFFLNSGAFILIVGGIFFLFGLIIGRRLLAQSKRRMSDREREEVIDSLKSEVSALKRRIAEQASKTKAALPAHGASGPAKDTTRESRMFYVWGEEDWQPPKIAPQPLHRARAFSIWIDDRFTPPFACFFLASRASTLWIEPDWQPPKVKGYRLPPSGAFSVWTTADFSPLQRVLFSASQAGSLWTAEDWHPPQLRPQPQPRSRAFSLWTARDYRPPLRILFTPSQAFTVWAPYRAAPSAEEEAHLRKGGRSGWSRLSGDTPYGVARTSVLSRAFGAAKSAFGRKRRPGAPEGDSHEAHDDHPPKPAAPTQPVVSDLPAAPPASSLPPSHAFTIWTHPEKIIEPGDLPKHPVLKSIVAGSSGATSLSAPKKPKESASPPEGSPPEPAVPEASSPLSHGKDPFPAIEAEPATFPRANSALLFMPDLIGGQALMDRDLGILFVEKPERPDDLTQIKGLHTNIQAELNELGVYTFKQIALWTEDQTVEFSNRLAKHGHVIRERWIEHAKALHFRKHGEKV